MIHSSLQNILRLTTEMCAALEGDDFELFSDLFDQRAQLFEELKAFRFGTDATIDEASRTLRDAIIDLDQHLSAQLDVVSQRKQLAIEELSRLRIAAANYSGAGAGGQLLRTDLTG